MRNFIYFPNLVSFNLSSSLLLRCFPEGFTFYWLLSTPPPPLLPDSSCFYVICPLLLPFLIFTTLLCWSRCDLILLFLHVCFPMLLHLPLVCLCPFVYTIISYTSPILYLVVILAILSTRFGVTKILDLTSSRFRSRFITNWVVLIPL